MSDKKTFLQHHLDSIQDAFLKEANTDWVRTQIEKGYADNVLRDWRIESFMVSGHETVIKWRRRIRPLTDNEIKKIYRK